MALVVIEGVDRTGKSTLARGLRDRWSPTRPVKVVHSSAPENDVLSEYVPLLAEYLHGERHHLVLDRSHIGEAVWPSLFGRDCLMTPYELALLNAAFHAAGALFVLCVRDEDELLEAFRLADPPEPLSEDLIGEACDRFHAQFVHLRGTGIPVFMYDQSFDAAWQVAEAARRAELDVVTRGRHLVLPASFDSPAYHHL